MQSGEADEARAGERTISADDAVALEAGTPRLLRIRVARFLRTGCCR